MYTLGCVPSLSRSESYDSVSDGVIEGLVADLLVVVDSCSELLSNPMDVKLEAKVLLDDGKFVFLAVEADELYLELLAGVDKACKFDLDTLEPFDTVTLVVSLVRATLEEAIQID